MVLSHVMNNVERAQPHTVRCGIPRTGEPFHQRTPDRSRGARRRPAPAHAVTIMPALPPTQRYSTGAVAEGVPGELRHHAQGGVYRGIRRAEGVSATRR